LMGGIQVAVVRVDPMPPKPDFNIITPDGVSHPFKNGPTGTPGETVRWVSQPIQHPDGQYSYEVTGHFSGPGYSGSAKQVFPIGSQCIPDPPQPPGLMFWCPDAIATTPDDEAQVLATLGMPDNPGTEVWWVPSCEFWFWHPGAPQPEMVWMGSTPFQTQVQPGGPAMPAPPDQPRLNWSERFDGYALGSSLHGQGDWKGWDNDPTVAALVTDEQARSAPHAAEIVGASDLVHEHAGYDSGRWAYTAWQYIPSDFESGGTDQFAGSYFILLNTYADGGPHESADWSVQMQFDSNDGMLKVYYGNGLNTINTPYDTDRWVKIQALVDLDADWTSIYYDDALIAEYAWTGGVLGDGGGAAQIAAVDFYASGSTPVYYDNISLRPAPPR